MVTFQQVCFHLNMHFQRPHYVHCGGVQRQNDRNCVTIQILVDLTVLSNIANYEMNLSYAIM